MRDERDIVDRLRWAAGSGNPLQCCVAMLIAADEIDVLRFDLAAAGAEIERLHGAGGCDAEQE
jgi:hypothetical protein